MIPQSRSSKYIHNFLKRVSRKLRLGFCSIRDDLPMEHCRLLKTTGCSFHPLCLLRRSDTPPPAACNTNPSPIQSAISMTPCNALNPAFSQNVSPCPNQNQQWGLTIFYMDKVHVEDWLKSELLNERAGGPEAF